MKRAEELQLEGEANKWVGKNESDQHVAHC